MRVLSRLFRRLFLKYLRHAFDRDKLRFSASLHALANRREFTRYLQPLQNSEWCVYAKPPFAGPGQVLDYVGRYTHRVAISNNRLLDIEDGNVQFLWRDYRDCNRQKRLTLAADEFIRRFLIHVLPDGFQRIRYYGFLANRHRTEKLTLCRQLLAMPITVAVEPVKESAADRIVCSPAESLRRCPLCQGSMSRVSLLAPPALNDSS